MKRASLLVLIAFGAGAACSATAQELERALSVGREVEAGFSRLQGVGPNVFVMDGRHPEVTSNTSADIGGTATATLVADGGRADRSDRARGRGALRSRMESR